MHIIAWIVILVLFPVAGFARRLNFIESHQLRLSSQQDPLRWVLPFHSVKNPKSWETNILFAQEKDVFSIYKDIESKNQDKIQSRLSKSFGQPYDVSAKVNAGYRSQNFAQFFSTNGGAVLLVNDPVFPELQGFLFHDYVSHTSYVFRPHAQMTLKAQIDLGARRVLDESYTAGDLVNKKVNIKFNKKPYIGFADFNLRTLYTLGTWGKILFEVNSLPIVNEYSYWDSFLGYQTRNFIADRNFWMKELSFYGGYSPVYGGHYDVGRTFKLGMQSRFWESIDLSVFTFDKYYPGASLSSRLGPFELSLITFERAYDDFGHQRSRQYGANLKLAW